MGATHREGGNLVFLQTMGDKFHRKVDKKTPGAKYRTNKDGVEVWELTYDGWEGYISSMKIRESKLDTRGMELFLVLYDPDEKEVPLAAFSWSLAGSHGQSIMQRIENVNPDKMVTISPYKIERKDEHGDVIKDKYNQGISLKQEGEKVESKYAFKEKEGDDREVLPPLEKKRVKGEKVWDPSDRIEFLREKVQDWINENASRFTKMIPLGKAVKKQSVYDDPTADDDDDDIPS